MDDSLCAEFLEGIFRNPALRRNRSCWGTNYENDLKYYLSQAGKPKGLLARLGLR